MTELILTWSCDFTCFCKILGMAHGLNILFGWDLFTCVFLTATGAVFHILLSVLLVSIIICLFINLCWTTLYLSNCFCLGHWEGKNPRTVCCRFCISFVYTWTAYQSTRSSIFHEWNTRGGCICANESSRSKSCTSQLLPSFLYCTGIISSCF